MTTVAPSIAPAPMREASVEADALAALTAESGSQFGSVLEQALAAPSSAPPGTDAHPSDAGADESLDAKLDQAQPAQTAAWRPDLPAPAIADGGNGNLPLAEPRLVPLPSAPRATGLTLEPASKGSGPSAKPGPADIDRPEPGSDPNSRPARAPRSALPEAVRASERADVLKAAGDAVRIADEKARPAQIAAAGSTELQPVPGAAPRSVAENLPLTGPAVRLIEIAPPLRSTAWGESFTSQIALGVANGTQTAQIRVSPAELGPITMSIEIDDGRARIAFAASAEETRAAIQQALPMLREQLAAINVRLDDAFIGAGFAGRDTEPRDARPPYAAQDPGTAHEDVASLVPRRPSADRIIDVYA